MMSKCANLVVVLVAMAAGGAAVADDPGGPSAQHRAQMRQMCKDNPEQCREAMQRRADQWWKKVDTDGDGTVSRAEAQANAPRLARDFDQVDADGDGKVTRDELEARGKAGMAQRRKAWWAKVDADGDGSISLQEAEANAPRLARDFSQVDANGDGKVTAEELRATRKK
jgi:hypothetical protein